LHVLRLHRIQLLRPLLELNFAKRIGQPFGRRIHISHLSPAPLGPILSPCLFEHCARNYCRSHKKGYFHTAIVFGISSPFFLFPSLKAFLLDRYKSIVSMKYQPSIRRKVSSGIHGMPARPVCTFLWTLFPPASV